MLRKNISLKTYLYIYTFILECFVTVYSFNNLNADEFNKI